MGASENEVLEGGHSQFSSSNMSVPFFLPSILAKEERGGGVAKLRKKLCFYGSNHKSFFLQKKHQRSTHNTHEKMGFVKGNGRFWVFSSFRRRGSMRQTERRV